MFFYSYNKAFFLKMKRIAKKDVMILQIRFGKMEINRKLCLIPLKLERGLVRF